MKAMIKAGVGPILFFVCYLVPFGGMDQMARGAIGLLLWMLLWWIMQPVGPSVTALLPILAAGVFKLADNGAVLKTYFNDTVLLLFSANIITLAWTKWGFDRRLSLMIMTRVGNNPKKLVAMWFILACGLSSMIANAVVAAVLFPIVLSTITAVGITEDKIKTSNYATAALLAVAWGSNVGFGTPLGGAMNLVSVNYIQDLIMGGKEFMYVDWVVRCVPMVIIIAVPMLAMLLTMKFEFKTLPNTKEVLQKELDSLGKMNRGEVNSLIVFSVCFILSFARPLFQNSLPTLTPTRVFFIGALISFLLPGTGPEPLVTWNYCMPKIKWGVFFLISGGTALGSVINGSGVGEMIANSLAPVAGKHELVAIVIFALIACAFSNIMTITGSMSLIQPIVIATMNSLGVNPVAFVFLSNAAGNISICLPSSGAGPAMVAGYGVDMKKMAKMGLRTVPVCLLSIIVLGYIMYLLWPGLGTLTGM